MKFQRMSLILVFAAIALGGVVYFTERKPPAEIKAEAKPIFAFKEQDVRSFTIQTPKQSLSFELPAGNTGSNWRMKTPEKTPADPGAIAFLLNLMATAKSDRAFPVPAARRSEFGFEQPTATVDVKLNNQRSHRLVIGKPNFNRNFLYALVDPPATPDLSVLLIPIDFQNAVDRPLAEWKRDKPKPSPAVRPSPTATP